MEKNQFAIKVDHISKTYKLYDSPQQRLRQSFTKKVLYKEFNALENVSFEISKGSVVGIVGRNGSGKSTLLQIIAGTLTPSDGKCIINGKIAALLELGSGFNPEFTGRENVYMSGSIYGINRVEMQRRFNDIEKFADIGSFIDQPVKTYSSGMFARLAFAVNINVDADILIVDEVLSVGDHFFQAKCMAAINELMNKGVTILLVSHSQATIKALCQKAILLDKGKLVVEGNCDEVMDRYMSISLSLELDTIKEYAEHNISTSFSSKGDSFIYSSLIQPPFLKRITERFGNFLAQFMEAALFQNGCETSVVESGKPCTISLWLQANENIDFESEIGIIIRTFEGIDLFALNSFFKNYKIEKFTKGEIMRIDFEFLINLGNGKYSVTLGMRSPVQGEYVDKIFNAIIFDVINTGSHTIPLLFDVPFQMYAERSNQ